MWIAIKLYEYFYLLESMQRRDSLGSTTKIPRLSKGSTRKFKTRRSQSSFSSASDAFAEDESTKGQPDLSVSEMKLRSEKNLDGNQGRSAEVGPASETLVDPFDEGERTLIRPDFEPDQDLEREEVERTEETSEHSEVGPREKVLYRVMSKSETKSYKWRKEPSHPTSTHSSLVKQSNNARMSSMSPSEEQTVSKAKKSWKSLYDERMASLRTECLSSGYDYPEVTHPDVNFTPCPRNDMSRKASSADQAHVRWDNDGSVINVRQIDDVDEQAKRRCVIKHQAAAAVELIFFGTNPVIWGHWRHK